jgi:hypothetical protein
VQAETKRSPAIPAMSQQLRAAISPSIALQLSAGGDPASPEVSARLH